MRLAKLDNSLIGRTLSVPIKTADGKRLVSNNVIITDKLLERLKSYGMGAIYIEDENIDVTMSETINEDKKTEILLKLNSFYNKISSQNSYDEFELSKIIRTDIFPEVNNKPVSLSIGNSISGYDITQHSLNVCLLAIATGNNLGLNMDKIEILAKASLLHDIGKIFKSKDSEMDHTQLGYDFLKTRTNSVYVYTLVKFHHETIDGQGIHKLTYQNQNELMKILSLCNFYESMLNQKSLIPNECFENIQALVNIKFEQQIFEAFRKSIFIYPTGLPVRLNNGEEGIVVKQNAQFPLRPFVRSMNAEYNLLESLTIFIEKVLL